jgi:hypothetical protein
MPHRPGSLPQRRSVREVWPEVTPRSGWWSMLDSNQQLYLLDLAFDREGRPRWMMRGRLADASV